MTDKKKNNRSAMDRNKMKEELRLTHPCSKCGKFLNVTRATLYHGKAECEQRKRQNAAKAKKKN